MTSKQAIETVKVTLLLDVANISLLFVTARAEETREKIKW
jgi:hypothetical protein